VNRAYFSSTIADFLTASPDAILATLTRTNAFALEQTQRDAWLEQIDIMKNTLETYRGNIYFEYSIPRMGKRIDVLLLIGAALLVLEFKVGERNYPAYAIDQVFDYAVDMKNFHETSHECLIAPILVCTKANETLSQVATTPHNDNVLFPLLANSESLRSIIDSVLQFATDETIQVELWEKGRYSPTPTIIEAAVALYGGHSVKDISSSEAKAVNLSQTSNAVSEIIKSSRESHRKSICFVTGVPGAGKTLVGLDIATKLMDKENELYSVFLSGNAPLVAILREALTRDRVHREKIQKNKMTKKEAMRQVSTFIQNVHNFRDEYIDDLGPPPEHVALFDEAQRAWNLTQTINFMTRKKHKPNFNKSESEFLISCLDRHTDWAVIVCLVGGGQEINTGEAGISEWIKSLNRSFQHWDIYISPQLSDSEYGAGVVLEQISTRPNVHMKDELHLSVSMRSFRAEHISLLVKQFLDLESSAARQTLSEVNAKYPIVITRDLAKAKQWLKTQARGTERYGMIVSSQALRLKPYAIDVKSPMDPIHWFLDGKEDVRSSYYLEDVATEFQVQGLELDWACVMWDADFRFTPDGWEHWSFCGDKWNHIRKDERKQYLKNAYRVLLTRARQGMVIVVPPGDAEDHTRKSKFYDATFEYLKDIGFTII